MTHQQFAISVHEERSEAIQRFFLVAREARSVTSPREQHDLLFLGVRYRPSAQARAFAHEYDCKFRQGSAFWH
ncbi:MAG: hypothetical protein AB7E72_18605 [Lysobacterales bacterium]